MQYGYFDDKHREYVITTPRTPLPWINYLGSEDFFTLLSNTAGGYSFYRDARLRRLTRYRYNNSPLDSEGFRIYLRDGETVWNPGCRPSGTELDSYCCRHGLGYTILEGRKNGVSARQEFLVPKGDPCLLMRVTVQNQTAAQKKLRLFPYIEFCLWDAMDDSTNFQRNYSIGEVEVKGAAIYHKTEYRERRDHYAVFWANRQPDAFDTSRDAFLGVYGSPAAPEAVSGDGCTGSMAHGWQPVAAQQFDLCLAPGEACSIIFGLGYIENPQEEKWESPGVINKTKAEAMMARYADDAAFDSAMTALREYWTGLLSRFQASTGDEKTDRMVNIWNQYQCMVTFNMSRSASYFESGMGRGMGFRDSCQDLLGFVHMIPERARERILDIAATQFPDGSAYHQYQPLTKKGNLAVGSGFNDDPLWLIAGTDAYLRETGDFSILDEPVDFDNDPDITLHFVENNTISKFYLIDGEELDIDDSNGVWLDKSFADAKSLKVGDNITFEFENYKIQKEIKGIGYSPEYVYHASSSSVIPDFNKIGFAYLSHKAFPGDNISYNVLNVKFDGSPETYSDLLSYHMDGYYSSFVERSEHTSVSQFSEEMDQHKMMGDIFPVVFILIAMLILLTTMTRIITHQRTQIGILKASGFKNYSIILHYVSYGFWLVLTGSILGLILGPMILPQLFYPSMSATYKLPSWNPAWSMNFVYVAAAMVLMSLAVSLYSVKSISSEKPADTIRPKVPKVSTSGFIERLGLWKRLSFNVSLELS